MSLSFVQSLASLVDIAATSPSAKSYRQAIRTAPEPIIQALIEGVFNLYNNTELETQLTAKDKRYFRSNKRLLQSLIRPNKSIAYKRALIGSAGLKFLKRVLPPLQKYVKWSDGLADVPACASWLGS